MASMVLLPDGTTGINQWTTTGALYPYTAVGSDDDNSSFIYETRNGHEITFTMADPGVLEAAIDFDETVTVSSHMTAHYHGGGAGTVDMTIQMKGTGIFSGISTQTVIVDDTYPIYNGVSSNLMAPGTPWTYTGLENLQIKLDCTGTPARFTALRVSYVYIRVDYSVPTVTSVDNATFFGANF